MLASASRFDAVLGQTEAYRELFERWGMAGGVYAPVIEHGTGVHDLARLRPASDDLLVIHYSGYVPRMAQLLELPQRKLLVYHNITPARYYWNFQPLVALICELSREQLPRYARAVEVAAGVSAYNARELEEAGARAARVVPIVVDPDRFRQGGPRSDGRAGGPLVLAVGRLAPHKRHDLVIRAFALYQRHCAPDARLLCVGAPLTPAYKQRLEELVEASGARNVTLSGRLSQPALNEAYASASAMLSLSEHEGFCVPLLEAFHFDLPVVARPAGGMPEVGGDAVLWVDDPDLATVSELLDLAVRDRELREELGRRGRRRLAEYSYERTSQALRSAVDAALA